MNKDTWNEIREHHKLQLQVSTFVLSAANNSKLQSDGTIRLRLYPDVTESKTLEVRILHLIFSSRMQNSTF